jgi:ABC-type nickel/cobalt efflux system permease component RcnA
MRALIAILAVTVAAVLAALYLGGGDRMVLRWAMDGQQTAQTAMARGLRALRAGDLAALGGFLGVCFTYGFFHAAGPGHGKLLIGGYGAARAVGAVRLSVVAVLSSLSQAATAIALVAVGLWLVGWGRERMTDMAEDILAPLSFAAIAVVGLWLVWRGLRGLLALRRAAHDHLHAHDADCDHCGHAHGPTPAAVAAARDWRALAALIGAVAIRPCTGALFVLILTAQMGIFGIGIAGVIVMGLGTASVTVAVAVAAVTLRRGALAGLAGSPFLARAQPVLELSVGMVVALVAGQLALAAI